MTLRRRIEAIQRTLGVEDDGIVGVDTVSALERVLGIADEAAGEVAAAPGAALTLSRAGIDRLIGFEIGSAGNYRRKLERPIWPGGASGPTIGIGYDLGYRTRRQIREDWGPHVGETDLAHLVAAAGIRGQPAEGATRALRQAGVTIPLEAAGRVFHRTTLPEYAARTRRLYPGVQTLPPDAQAALVSLVYNRGESVRGARRVEMANIKPHVRRGDLEAIADEIESMKRLWEGKGLPGLLVRRDAEAELVRASARRYAAGDVMFA
jgi:GH24 family phage-related lysozyme (muramidase)